jgi:23S rRNA (uracil1939-C5)-methyltransferase
MVLSRTLKVSIKKLSSKGFGVFEKITPHKNTTEIELFNALPGEKISVEEFSKNKKNLYVIKEWLKLSQGRQDPPCPYFGRCGGCQTLHMSDDMEAAFKRQKVIDALQSFGVRFLTVSPVQTYGQRERRRFRFEVLRHNNRIIFGLRRFHSNQLIDLESCYVADQSISDLLTPIKIFLTENTQEGFKASVSVLKVENGLDLDVQPIKNAKGLCANEKQTLDFMKSNGVTRLTYQEKSFVLQHPFILIDGLKVYIHQDAFMQASYPSEKAMQSIVASFLPTEKRPLMIADLYCGLGTFLIPLSRCHRVHGYESNIDAVRSLKDALNRGRVTSSKVEARDLKESPLSQSELLQYNCIVINPPRVGVAYDQLIQIGKSDVERIIYVSCNPDTFARDCMILDKFGYSPMEIIPIDQFYGSYHIEIVAVLVRS